MRLELEAWEREPRRNHCRSSQLSHGPRTLKFRILKDIWPDRNMDSATSRARDHYNHKPIV
jgi:hypothetical protein